MDDIGSEWKVANLQESYNSEFPVLYLNAHIDLMTYVVVTVANYEILYTTVSNEQEKESRE